MEFEAHLQTAIDATKKAGDILRGHFKVGVSAIEKSVDETKQGLVTVADLEAETAIIETIKASFPEHAFLAEESLATGNNPDELWVIDPLDGTNNFAFGIPHFGISVAYWHHGQPAVGIVLDPLREEQFVAVKGCGATLNGKPISVSTHQSVCDTVVATGFYYDRGEMMKRTLRCVETLFENEIQGMRRMGAASLDLAWVACGRFGSFFELKLSPWDFAAAHLILTEAGGQITDCNGDPVGLDGTSVLATNGLLHDQMLKLIHKGG